MTKISWNMVNFDDDNYKLKFYDTNELKIIFRKDIFEVKCDLKDVVFILAKCYLNDNLFMKKQLNNVMKIKNNEIVFLKEPLEKDIEFKKEFDRAIRALLILS
jgi:hypothetical protein